jgi:hypothetical protein
MGLVTELKSKELSAVSCQPKKSKEDWLKKLKADR